MVYINHRLVIVNILAEIKMKRTNRKKFSVHEPLLGFYKDSYKKYKYWLNAYYIVIIIITISIPLNTNDWKVFFEYNQIIDINKKIV